MMTDTQFDLLERFRAWVSESSNLEAQRNARNWNQEQFRHVLESQDWDLLGAQREMQKRWDFLMSQRDNLAAFGWQGRF
jgi:hypothetical protein